MQYHENSCENDDLTKSHASAINMACKWQAAYEEGRYGEK